MSEFEAQCDCVFDSPGVLSHLPVEERLVHWTEFALEMRSLAKKMQDELDTIEARNKELETEIAHLRKRHGVIQDRHGRYLDVARKVPHD